MAYAFLVQCFENATIVAYAGLRVKSTIYAPSLCLKEAIYHHLLFFEGISMVNFKTTINYNNVLIKAQLNYIVTVSASEILSKRPVCIKVFERYYIVFALT